jgi:hypothetical protein
MIFALIFPVQGLLLEPAGTAENGLFIRADITVILDFVVQAAAQEAAFS